MKTRHSFVPLAQLCEFVTVGHVGITSPYYREVGIPFLRTQNVGAGTVDLSDIKFITAEFHNSLRKTQLKPGDLLLSRVVTDVMKCAIVPPSLAEANCANVILIRPKQGLSSRFLLHLINSPIAQEYLLGKRVGSAQQVVNTGILKAWLVPNLSLDEQKRIVEVLDAAFEGLSRARAHTETNLQNARELFESRLTTIFRVNRQTKTARSIEDIARVTSSKRISQSEYVTEGVPFFRTKEIKLLSNEEPISTEIFISRERFAAIKERFGAPQAGDIMVTAIGTIGQIYVVQDEDEFYFKDGNVLWLKEIHSVSPSFLRYSLKSFVEELNRLSHGAAYNALPIAKLCKHMIDVPSSAAQDAIVGELDYLQQLVNQLQSHYRAKLADLDALRQALLQKAFAGELT